MRERQKETKEAGKDLCARVCLASGSFMSETDVSAEVESLERGLFPPPRPSSWRRRPGPSPGINWKFGTRLL